VDVEVISQETRGLLGILGYSEAKVRVTVKSEFQPPAPAPASPPFAARSSHRLEAVEEIEEIEDLEDTGGDPPPPPPGGYSPAAEAARDITAEILSRMEMAARPEITGEDLDTVYITIRGNLDLSLLIGKQGQTLNALQLIVAMMANHARPEEERKRLILDAADYRNRRERALSNMACRAAERAKSTGREVPLQPLNARERRIVHLALAGDNDVATRSEGEDPERYIIVAPRRR
jgi:spoIIIJ-associated protein